MSFNSRGGINPVSVGLLIAVAMLGARFACAEDWPRWGGRNDRNMVSREPHLASSFVPGQKKTDGSGIDWATTKNVKWVTGIEVVDYDAKGFYEMQGWGPNFVIPTRSDIFSPKRTRHRGQDSFDQALRVNQEVSLRGRAFAGDRGVEKVEVSLDDGQTWQPTTIDYPGTRLTWVFWSYAWTPKTTGDYVLVCRATDQNGDLQTSDVRGTAPQGATGLHKVKASVV